MNPYEQKQAARRSRYEARAARATAQAAELFERADLREEKSGIPFGQPILVGHHSENRHRNAIKRADTAMRKGVEAVERAQHYEAKAAGVGLGGISSDDPDALAKLRAQLAEAEAEATNQKRWNAQFRKGGVDAMDAPESVKASVRHLVQCCPYITAPFHTANRRANIRRIADRIAQLEKLAAVQDQEEEIHGVTLRLAASENRVQLLFEGKPADAIRAELKRAGFRWAPSVGAWQRHYGNGAIYDARRILEKMA